MQKIPRYLEIKQHTSESKKTYPLVEEEIKREVRKYFVLNSNKNTTQYLQDTAKEVLRGKFITLNVHIRHEESTQSKETRKLVN